MQPIGPDRIEATLFTNGLELCDYFLVGDTPMFWGRLGDKTYPWAQVIENAALSRACVEYLRQHGVKEYATIGELPKPPE